MSMYVCMNFMYSHIIIVAFLCLVLLIVSCCIDVGSRFLKIVFLRFCVLWFGVYSGVVAHARIKKGDLGVNVLLIFVVLLVGLIVVSGL